jgi:hypothetical protein
MASGFTIVALVERNEPSSLSWRPKEQEGQRLAFYFDPSIAIGPGLRRPESTTLLQLLDAAWPSIPSDELSLDDDDYAALINVTNEYEAQIAERIR